MPVTSDPRSTTRSRVTSACRRCRRHKIRCSGELPCRTCHKRGSQCEYKADEKRIAVSESTLRELQRESRELEELRKRFDNSTLPSTNDQSAQDVLPSSPSLVELADLARGEDHSTNTFVHHADEQRTANEVEASDRDSVTPMTNPLVTRQPEYLYDSAGKLRYLGHSSTWSFTQQLLHKSSLSPHSPSNSTLTFNIEASVYPVDGKRTFPTVEDLKSLPSYEVAIFYMQTVQFRTFPLYHLFDDAEFAANMRSFYSDMMGYANQNPTWFVHYLVIMAFGKTFNTRHEAVKAGLLLFNRAILYLPDISVLCHDPVPSTELLVSIALYLQSVDHRTAAHVYIGQAMRVAQSYGLHAGTQGHTLPENLATRGRDIWWTVYTLDRRLSASFGAPSGLRDEDINVPLPTDLDSSSTSVAQSIHIRISRVLGRIVNTVYSNGDTFHRAFIPTIQEVLRGAAPLIDELAQFADQCAGQISRVAAHLSLSYHQCIILATRPLLFYLLGRQLENSNFTDNLRLSPVVQGILQVCVDSGLQSLNVLNSLREHDLLDVFLPFDLECLFSTALVLLITTIIAPRLLPRHDWSNTCAGIFEHMQERDNKLATLRKAELDRLAQIRSNPDYSILISNERQINDTRSTTTPTNHQLLQDHVSADMSSVTADPKQSFSDLSPFFTDWLIDSGLSEENMIDLANSLGSEDVTL